MTLNTPQKITVAFLAFLFVFWVILFQMGTTTGFYNYLYSFLFGLIPLVGGAVAMSRAKQWGGLQTAIGKAVFLSDSDFFCGGAVRLFGLTTIFSWVNQLRIHP